MKCTKYETGPKQDHNAGQKFLNLESVTMKQLLAALDACGCLKLRLLCHHMMYFCKSAFGPKYIFYKQLQLCGSLFCWVRDFLGFESFCAPEKVMRTRQLMLPTRTRPEIEHRPKLD